MIALQVPMHNALGKELQSILLDQPDILQSTPTKQITVPCLICQRQETLAFNDAPPVASPLIVQLGCYPVPARHEIQLQSASRFSRHVGPFNGMCAHCSYDCITAVHIPFTSCCSSKADAAKRSLFPKLTHSSLALCLFWQEHWIILQEGVCQD